MGAREKRKHFRSLGKNYSIITGAVWGLIDKKGFSSKALSNPQF